MSRAEWREFEFCDLPSGEGGGWWMGVCITNRHTPDMNMNTSVYPCIYTCLRDGVLVGALDQDGARLGVLHVLHKGVPVLAVSGGGWADGSVNR